MRQRVRTYLVLALVLSGLGSAFAAYGHHLHKQAFAVAALRAGR